MKIWNCIDRGQRRSVGVCSVNSIEANYRVKAFRAVPCGVGLLRAQK